MQRTAIVISTMALVAALGCSSQEKGTGGVPDAGDSALSDADAGDSALSDADAGDSGSTDASTPDAIAPAFCTATLVEAGAVSEGDAGTPRIHRAAAACCPSQRGPGTGQPYPPGIASPLGADAGGCTSDSDCKSGVNGRCYPFEGLVGIGGCSYDECFVDWTCGSQATCLCRASSTDNLANVCVPAGNCVVDSDCGPRGYCSPSLTSCEAEPAYYCHTASDTCVNDSDCPSVDAGESSCPLAASCVYSAQARHWACNPLFCCPP